MECFVEEPPQPALFKRTFKGCRFIGDLLPAPSVAPCGFQQLFLRVSRIPSPVDRVSVSELVAVVVILSDEVSSASFSCG